MSTQYNGLGGNIALHSSFNISASTNATPIKITTSAPHDFSEGDLVFVSGHASNTNANGLSYVHVFDGSNVQLYGLITTSGGLTSPIAGNGVGAATGTIRGVGFLPTFQVPSDGDNVTAASVNVGLEAGADAYQRLAAIQGAYSIVYSMNKSVNGLSSGTAAPVLYGTETPADTTWRRQAVVNGGTILIDFFDGGAFPYPYVMNNDIIELEWQVAYPDATVGSIYFALGVEYFDAGGAPAIAVDGVATSAKLQGSARLLNSDAVGIQPMTLRMRFKQTGLPRVQQMQAYILARTLAGGPGGYALKDDIMWTARILRPTGLVPVV